MANEEIRSTCDRCNRWYSARHLDRIGASGLCPPCAAGDAPEVLCWMSDGPDLNAGCGRPATTRRSWYGERDYELCEKHAATWRYDKAAS
jgi:hypothetical protein